MTRIRIRLLCWAIAALSAVGLAAGTAHAAPVTYTFSNITANSLANAATGEAQLSVTVSAGNIATQVKFRFDNAGPNPSSITDLYWDDGTLLGIASITDSGGGVAFSQGASPGNLPGGNPHGFQATAGFMADSDPAVQPNGVNPGEWVEVTFNLINGKTFADTITALAGGVDLRIGIHVQGFQGGGSESFVNGPPGDTVPVPAPPALLMGVIGFAGIAALRRFRKV